MVMPTRMNYDLTMGGDLLEKTGAGNLFMYFGEPDIEVKHAPAAVTPSAAKGPRGKGRVSSAAPQNDKTGKLIVTIKGLDIYDPTTGQIRSHSTDDIACLFIDTNPLGDPPALPGWQEEFDISGSQLYPRLFRFNLEVPTWRDVGFDFDRLRSGPFEGPAAVKPPALPEDT